MKLNRKRTISGNSFSIEKIVIKSIELREYLLSNNYECHKEKEVYMIYLAVDTDRGEFEIDYLGNPTKDRDKFDECFNFLCNYQGLSSSLNRIILEVKNDAI